MVIDVVTIFPKMFSPVIGESIIKRSQSKGLLKINLHDLRKYSSDTHKTVDDTSYGGGGMVFKPEPLFSAVEDLLGMSICSKSKKCSQTRVVLLSPKGKTLNQREARKFLKYERLILLAPRYEGVDERVRDYLVDDEVSIGDYILSGGELPAMVFIDCLARLIPGVVSDKDSIEQESFENSSLDFPHYTKPADFRGLKVPKVLLSGNHKEIKEWRKAQALKITKKRRPDLIK